MQNDTTYFGSVVGRVANRIGGAQFTLDGTHYKLVANEKSNMLHGTFLVFIALSGFFPGKKKNEVAYSVFLRDNLYFFSDFL